jgi:hypothetical protein
VNSFKIFGRPLWTVDRIIARHSVTEDNSNAEETRTYVHVPGVILTRVSTSALAAVVIYKVNEIHKCNFIRILCMSPEINAL